MTDFTGRTVVVTGCASGIGARTTQRLADLGASVIGVDRPEASVPEELAGSLTALIRADLSVPDGPAQVVDRIDGPIDLLVNNAGVAATRPWRQVIGLNVLAPRDLTRLLMPKFGPAPAVVGVASQAGFNWRTTFERSRRLLATPDWEDAFALLATDPDIQENCYTISKEAVIVGAITLATQREVPNLRVNTVSPGTVQTPLLADFTVSMGEAAIAGAEAWAGRHATPDDIAEAIVFLGSDRARWINGVDIPVDGGYGAQILSMVLPHSVQVPS